LKTQDADFRWGRWLELRRRSSLERFSRAQRMRRERIIGWTLAVFASWGMMAAGFSKAKACVL
jgi:hypothetical protein